MKRSYDNLDSNTRVIKKNKPVGSIFNGLLIYILSSRFGPRRLKIFETQVLNNGGQLYYTVTEDPKKVTHLIVEETIDKETLLKICVVKHFTNAKFLKCTWLTQCLKHNDLLPVNDYIVYENTHLKWDNESSDLCATSNESDHILNEGANSVSKTEGCSNTNNAQNKFLDKFACAHSSLTPAVNLNEHITSELEKLCSAYESRKDTWRAVGYHKAIVALKNYPSKIENWEETKNIRGIGERLSTKIREILEIGKLRKAEEICQNEETKVLQLFTGVWGAGATTANSWYIQGFRTLEDLRTKAHLTKHQEIGLKYYDELNERMTRSEVEEIGNQVKSAAEHVKEGLEVIICGSYRRGKTSCGDVDVLITHPDGNSHENIFFSLLEKLKENGFLTDDLVIQENNGNQQKYLGVCKLPNAASKHRRLDIIVVPYKEFAPAIMYFTGSAHFNRSMRLLATKFGMSLSEHGLRGGIVGDGRETVTGGTMLETPTEESIFKHLGLKYLPPCERNH